MIARSFKSVIWVATVGGAALCCYMVSLRVATERADLAKVERQIVAAKREIRSLQTELGTRGRMTQLEDWNANVLALSAPTSAQFVKDEVTLARFERNGPTVEERTAEVRMASAETGAAAAPPPTAAPPAEAQKPRVVHAVARPAPPSAHSAIRQASYTPASPATLPAQARAERKVERKDAAKPDRRAARPASDETVGTKVAPERKVAAKPAAADRKAPEKKLAHAKPASHPAAPQGSDAD